MKSIAVTSFAPTPIDCTLPAAFSSASALYLTPENYPINQTCRFLHRQGNNGQASRGHSRSKHVLLAFLEVFVILSRRKVFIRIVDRHELRVVLAKEFVAGLVAPKDSVIRDVLRCGVNIERDPKYSSRQGT